MTRMIRMAVAALWLMAPAASAQEPARVDPVVVTATKVETPASRVGGRWWTAGSAAGRRRMRGCSRRWMPTGSSRC